MKLYTFESNQQRRLGAEWEGQLIDLPTAYQAYLSSHTPRPGLPRALPGEMLSFVRFGSAALEAARETIAFIKKRPAVPVGEQLLYPFETVKLLAPIQRPGKIICLDIMDSEAGTTAEPFFSAKFSSAIAGPGEAIIHPRSVEHLDCDSRVTVIIGKRMKQTPPNEVTDFIFGYTILHDVCARGSEAKANQFFLSKNFDTFCPLGPCLVTSDEAMDVKAGRIRTRVNEATVPERNTSDIMSPLLEKLSFLSSIMTLEPGDVVAGGGPKRSTPFLRPGDRIVTEIDGIGRLENSVAAPQ